MVTVVLTFVIGAIVFVSSLFGGTPDPKHPHCYYGEPCPNESYNPDAR